MSELDANSSARNPAHSLAPILETVVNLHYLIDMSVNERDRVSELREFEDEDCGKMIALCAVISNCASVQENGPRCLAQPPGLTRFLKVSKELQ